MTDSALSAKIINVYQMDPCSCHVVKNETRHPRYHSIFFNNIKFTKVCIQYPLIAFTIEDVCHFTITLALFFTLIDVLSAPQGSMAIIFLPIS